jgi:hypothetical protein
MYRIECISSVISYSGEITYDSCEGSSQIIQATCATGCLMR